MSFKAHQISKIESDINININIYIQMSQREEPVRYSTAFGVFPKHCQDAEIVQQSQCKFRKDGIIYSERVTWEEVQLFDQQ